MQLITPYSLIHFLHLASRKTIGSTPTTLIYSSQSPLPILPFSLPFIIGESLMAQSLNLFSSYTHTFDHLIQSHGCKTIYMPVTLNYAFSSDLVSEPQIYIQLPTYYLHLDVKYTSQLNMFKMKLLIFLLTPFPLVSFSISDSGSSILSVAQVKT